MVWISDIQNERVLWDTVPYCEISEDEIDTYRLKENDILPIISSPKPLIFWAFFFKYPPQNKCQSAEHSLYQVLNS